MKARGLAIQAEQVQMLSGLQTQRYTVALLVRNSADCVNRFGNSLKILPVGNRCQRLLAYTDWLLTVS
jgi:hypothetical protein